MSSRQQLLQALEDQPEEVAGRLLMYLHSLPGYVPQAKPAEGGTANYWDDHWSKFYGAFEGEEWPELEEQPFEVREEW